MCPAYVQLDLRENISQVGVGCDKQKRDKNGASEKGRRGVLIHVITAFNSPAGIVLKCMRERCWVLTTNKNNYYDLIIINIIIYLFIV